MNEIDYYANFEGIELKDFFEDSISDAKDALKDMTEEEAKEYFDDIQADNFLMSQEYYEQL